jgi:membrane protein
VAPAVPSRRRAVAGSRRRAARLLARATIRFVEHRCTQHAAAISYYALLSLFPLALLAAAIFGVLLRNDAVEARVLDRFVDALPVEAPAIADSLRGLAGLGPTLTVVSLLVIGWAAGALGAAVRSALDVVFEVPRGRPLLRAKLFDYTLLLALGLLFLASVALTTAWRIAQAEFATRFGLVEGGLAPLWDLGALAIPALLTFAAVLLLYHSLPHRPLRIAHVWPGALLATAAFELAKAGFASYVAAFGRYELVYGSLGGVIALMFWVYLSANILLFGAELAAARADAATGLTPDPPGDWRRALRALVRGLVLAPPDGPDRDP